MKILISTALVLFTLSVQAHDIRLAIFELSESASGDYLSLNVSMDKEDLQRSISNLHPDFADASATTKENWIVAYLKENFKITAAQDCAEITNFDLSYEEDFVKIKARVKGLSKPIRQIQIQNTCLIDYTEGHSNIIKCKLHGKLRSFRLTEDRVSTVIEY